MMDTTWLTMLQAVQRDSDYLDVDFTLKTSWELGKHKIFRSLPQLEDYDLKKSKNNNYCNSWAQKNECFWGVWAKWSIYWKNLHWTTINLSNAQRVRLEALRMRWQNWVLLNLLDCEQNSHFTVLSVRRWNWRVFYWLNNVKQLCEESNTLRACSLNANIDNTSTEKC